MARTKTIRGSAGDDAFYGYGRPDTYILWGYAGNDTLYSGRGNDIVYGGDGRDRVYSGDGDDLVYGDAGNDKLDGGWGDDTLYGGDGDDYIIGGHSTENLRDDSPNDLYGNDILYGGNGDDTLKGGMGNDQLTGGNGRDKFSVRSNSGENIVTDFVQGEDKINIDVAFADLRFSKEHYTSISETGTNDDDALDLVISANGAVIAVLEDFSGELTDTEDLEFHLHGGDGDDTLNGGNGNDSLFGLSGDNTLNGGNGDDELYSRQGDDTLNGGNGNDWLSSSSGDDTLNGGDGDDRLYGGHGHDTLHGGDGNDRLYGDSAWFREALNEDDTLNGGDGDDSLHSYSGSDTLNGGDGNDRLFGGRGVSTLDGGNGYDYLRGGSGRDVFVIRANSGVDVIANFEQGKDEIRIGTEFANLQFSKEHYTSKIETRTNDDNSLDLVISANGAVIAVLEDFVGSLTMDDFFFLIEGTASHDTLFGSNGNDIIYGYDGQDHVSAGTGNDRIYGGDGNDVIFAGVGDDHLDGGNGDDHLHGQEDKDIFVLDLADKGKDTIENFEQGIDKISITYEHYYQITDKVGNINMVGKVIRNAEGEDVLVLKDFEGTLTRDDFKMALSFHTSNPFGTVDENDEGADIDNLRFTFNDEIDIDDLTLVDVFGGDYPVSDKLKIKDHADGTYGLKLKEGQYFDYEQRDFIYLTIEHDGERLGGGTLLIDVNEVLEEVVEDVNDVAETVDESLNLIEGTAGADYLYGTSGDDLIRGNGDADYMLGGLGSDIFELSPKAHNLIADFEKGVDKIRVGFEFEDILFIRSSNVHPPSATNDSTKLDLVLITPGAYSIVLEDFDFDNPLTADDFEFVALEVV